MCSRQNYVFLCYIFIVAYCFLLDVVETMFRQLPDRLYVLRHPSMYNRGYNNHLNLFKKKELEYNGIIEVVMVALKP